MPPTSITNTFHAVSGGNCRDFLNLRLAFVALITYRCGIQSKTVLLLHCHYLRIRLPLSLLGPNRGASTRHFGYLEDQFTADMASFYHLMGEGCVPQRKHIDRGTWTNPASIKLVISRIDS